MTIAKSTRKRAAHEFTVQDSTLLIDAPILAVRRDTVVMPGGRTAAREVVEHLGAVAVAAVNDGRIHLIHQYRHAVGTRLWELPAGLLDVRGEDPLVAAQRELKEEAGLTAGEWSFLLDVVSAPGFCDEVVRVYRATDVSECERPESDDEEADMTSRWVDLDEAVQMVLRGEVHNSTAVAGIMTSAWYEDHASSARPVNSPFPLRPTALPGRRGRSDATDLKRC